jgi:hypothetical protein
MQTFRVTGDIGERHIDSLPKCRINGPKVHGLNCRKPCGEQTTEAWRKIKENGERLLNPDQGGCPGIFKVRPVTSEVYHYCIYKVAFLHILRQDL